MNTKTENLTKPPLGVAPASVRCPERIKDLADAISRQTDPQVGTMDPTLIKGWALEIIMQCDIWLTIGKRVTAAELDNGKYK